MYKRTLSLTFVMALAGCASTSQEAFDRGYWRGASDAIKREYWSKQRAERTRSAQTNGQELYYYYDLPEQTEDGRKLQPQRAPLPVVE